MKRDSPGRVIRGSSVRLFVEENDICTPLEEGVSSRETGEATTDDDNTNHLGWKAGRKVKEETNGLVRAEMKAHDPAPITVTRIRIHVFFIPPHETPELDLHPARCIQALLHLFSLPKQ